jgi:glycerol-3-phosphate dehydrogenase (NAD(P)+)
MMAAIGVIGAGAWGTALAQVLASDGSEVLLWAREPELVEEINAAGPTACSCLGFGWPETIRATGDLADLAACQFGAAGRHPGAASGRVLPVCPMPRAIWCCAPRGSRPAPGG